MTKRAFACLFALGISACGGRSEFSKAMHAADERLEKRDLVGTEQEWTLAEKAATNDEERVEAIYRLAHLRIRVKRRDEGRKDLERIFEKFPNSGRAARALLDLGHLDEDLGNGEQARARYEVLLEKYPTSGNAKAALSRLLALASDGTRENERLAAKLRDPALLSFLRYDHAVRVAQADPARGAKEFEECARVDPLPKGLYTDEALLRAANLRIEIGEFALARTNLEKLVEPIESAWLVGSYHRTNYAEALFLLGLLAKEHDKNVALARGSFERLVNDFPESRIRDDAEYELSLLDRDQGKTKEACERLRKTVERDARTRFRRCEEFLCSNAVTPLPYCAGRKLETPEPTPK